MNCQASLDDISFRDQVESCDFPVAEFGHRAHVRLAYVYLASNQPDDSADLMKSALLGLLRHNGIDLSKYHETLTKAWIMAVAHFMEHTESAVSADAFIEQNPSLLDSNIMLHHYSADLLFSDAARGTFIKPDIADIPGHARRDA